jgi:1-acyl-sn-glycerol-3-phosphate acyltransferase
MLKRLYLLGRIGLAGLAFLGFGAGGVILACLVLPLSRLLHRQRPRMQRAEASQRWVQRSFSLLHAYMRACGLLHFDPRSVATRTLDHRCVVVANHPTLVDVTAIVATFGRVACIVKRPLFRVPFFGSVLRACAYLDGGSGDAFSGASVVSQALACLAEDMPVLIFPEGTRSPDGGMRTFKRGAFEIACRAQSPVLPLLIRCAPSALGKGRPWYDIPPRTAFLTVTALPPLLPESFGGDAERMTRACEDNYRQHLNAPTDGSSTAHA